MHQIRRWFGSSTGDELLGHNAYDVLEVLETSTFSDIKASFRRLAKETHPDLSPSPYASRRFLLIVAAYKILSDSERRAQYDSYLLSHRKKPERQTGLGRHVYAYNSSVTTKQVEAVDWLELYRLAIDDILSHRKVASNSVFGMIENEFYSAIHAAYYGPLIESLDFLPDCFEAEERSDHETHEVLHLVSGRDLFGMVNLASHVPRLPHNQHYGLTFPGAINSRFHPLVNRAGSTMNSAFSGHGEIPDMQVENCGNHVSDAYDDLELQISGKVVATATRISPSNLISRKNSVDDPQDVINVFLKLSEERAHSSRDAISPSAGSVIPLGTIKGLGTGPEEGSCFVYNKRNEKTHVIMKHRTLMVKHMYWYRIGDKVSPCECRCSRARLPPSKFWLFAPRCDMHDIGGWYIETFGQDKNGRNVPSQRQWDDVVGCHERRLHPAMYLMALAYRTLDIEVAKRRKGTIRNLIEPMLSSILSFGKKLR